MPSALDQNTTQSRKDMICPNCQQRGLKKAPKYAAQCGDSKKQRIIYATGCSNPECKNHPTRNEPARVPPEAIKRQYSDSDGIKIPINASITRVLIGVIAVIGIVGLLFSGGGVLSDNLGSAQASPTLSESSDGVAVVDTLQPWTIYKADGEYYVAAVRNGETVYLNRNGEVVSHLVTFGDEDSARTAIREWQTRKEQGLTNETLSSTPEDLVGGSEWTVYERNGTAFIAAERNGEVVYLNPSLEVQNSPYFYDNASIARDTLIEFESTPSGLVDNTDWEPIEYGDSIFVGATPDSGPRAGETVFLQPNGTVSDDPYFYNSTADANDAINNFDGWDSVERSTVDFDGDDQDSSGTSSGSWSDNYNTVGDEAVRTDFNETEQTGDEDYSTVRGSVTDNNGEPVEGATVHLYSNHYTTTTDSSGTYKFTDVPLGEHKIHIEPPAGSGLTATENTTFTLKSEGITSVEDTPTSSYFMRDGLASQNKINFNPRTEQPIKVTGEGTNASASITFANERNADDVSITLSDRYTAGISKQTISSSTTEETVSVTGGAYPQTQAVAVDGEVVSSSQSETLSDGDTFTRTGNIPGENATVSVTGRETTNQRTVSGSGDSSIMNRGNTETTGTFTVTGSTVENQRTVTRTGTSEITNNGNLDTEATITVQGSSTDLGTQSTSGSLNDGDSFTINVGGSAPAENVQIELTGNTDKYDVARDQYNPYGPPYLTVECYKGTGYDNCYYYDQASHQAQQDSKFLLEWSADLSAQIKEPDEWYKDRTGTVGGRVKAYYESGKYDRDELLVHESIRCEACVEKDKYTSGSVTFYMEKGDYYRADAWGYTNGDFNSIGEGSYDMDSTLYRLDGPGSTSIIVDGQTVNTATVGPDETRTINLGTLEPGQHTIKIDSANGVGASYTASWDERDAVTDLSVDANGDGQSEITRSAPLADGETVETTVELGTGTTQVEINNNGPSPRWDATYTERTATEDLRASISGGGTEKQVSSLLREGESATVQLKLPPGQQDIEFSHTGPAPTWQSEFTERSVTKSPTVTVGEGEVSKNGFLGPDDEITAPGDSLDSKTYQVETSTASGPQPVVTIDYTAKAIAEDAVVTINGEKYRYPDDFDESGRLTRQTDEINTTSLTTGNNDISVSAAPVDGIETKAIATLRYPSESLQTTRPTVHVIQPDGTVTSKPVPQVALTGEQLTDSYTMSLDKNAFGAGENVIIVETPDGSQVGVEVTGTSSMPQSDIFEPTEAVPHNATLP